MAKTTPSIIVLDKPLSLVQGSRKSTAHAVPDTFLFWGDRSVNLDKLDARLERLRPHAYGNATVEQWRPFIQRCVALGLL
jgi:hypothetical protein